MRQTAVYFTKQVWFSQLRDKVENDNMSAAMKIRFAADMERWAKSRANEPAFAQVCFAAVKEAQAIRKEYAPKAV